MLYPPEYGVLYTLTSDVEQSFVPSVERYQIFTLQIFKAVRDSRRVQEGRAQALFV